MVFRLSDLIRGTIKLPRRGSCDQQPCDSHVIVFSVVWGRDDIDGGRESRPNTSNALPSEHRYSFHRAESAHPLVHTPSH